MAAPLPSTFAFTGTPYAHQRKVLAESWDMPAYALFHEMGTGKTYTAIHNAAALDEARLIDLVVVIAPKGVYRNWEGEIADHWPGVLAPDVETWGIKRRKGDRTRTQHGLRFFLMNVEALSTKRGAGMLNAVVHGRRTMLIVDESTSIKNHKAKRTEALIAVARKCDFVRILTGSPITKSPLDLFGQLSVMMPDPFGLTSFYAFRSRYAETRKRTVKTTKKVRGAGGQMIAKTVERKFEEVVGYRRLDELQERLAPYSSRVLKEECLDLPEKVYTRRVVELTPEQRAAYGQMVEKAKAELGGLGQVTAPQAITQILRLHQITCGFAKTDDGAEHALKSNRMTALFEVLEELAGEKVVIWAPYRRSILDIACRLGDEYGHPSVMTYFGDTKGSERPERVRRFQEDPDCLYFVGNAQTAGYGLTLTAASNVVYFANSWKLMERLQSEDRAHRIGQRRSVSYTDLVAPGTVDERIINSLRESNDIAGEVLGEQWRTWLDWQ